MQTCCDWLVGLLIDWVLRVRWRLGRWRSRPVGAGNGRPSTTRRSTWSYRLVQRRRHLAEWSVWELPQEQESRLRDAHAWEGRGSSGQQRRHWGCYASWLAHWLFTYVHYTVCSRLLKCFCVIYSHDCGCCVIFQLAVNSHLAAVVLRHCHCLIIKVWCLTLSAGRHI